MKKLIFSLLLLLFSSSFLSAQIRIKMKQKNGIYTTPCTVNGLRLSFIFDTGASTVSLSSTEAEFMLKNGYLDEADIHGSFSSQIANGDIIKNTTVTLRNLEIGGIMLHNIEAVIIDNLSAPLLLGQSAIQKLGKIQLEGDELVIINAHSLLSDDACVEAQKLVKKAHKYWLDDKLCALAADTYQKAYDLCPEALDCSDVDGMGTTYYFSEQYKLAIKYFKKSLSCLSDSIDLSMSYTFLGNSYSKLGNFQLATLYIQKALSYATRESDKSTDYFYLAFICNDQKKYNKAIDYFKKSVEHQLKLLSATTNNVMKGEVKDDMLGETYWNISVAYYNLNQQRKSDNYKIKSALCGYEYAIEYCRKYGLKYKLYVN